MSAAVYWAEVVEKRGRKVKIRLYIVHADETRFCIKKNCALQLLWEQVHPVHRLKSALGDEMSMENRLDVNWVLVNEDRFIAGVTLLETKNYPAPPGFSFNEHLKKKKGLPQAVIEVEVTDAKWIKHMKKGQTWNTAPYDMEDYI
jgi:hypothetical protein